VYGGPTMSNKCWYLPTDESIKIGPWIGPLTMIQGRANAVLTPFQDKA